MPWSASNNSVKSPCMFGDFTNTSISSPPILGGVGVVSGKREGSNYLLEMINNTFARASLGEIVSRVYIGGMLIANT